MTLDEMEKHTDIPVIFVDQNGLITFINESFQHAFGWLPKDLIGFPLLKIIPSNLASAHILGFSRFLVSQKSTILNKALDLRIVKKDGTEIPAEHFIIAENRSGIWVFGATVIPKPEESNKNVGG